MITIHDEIENFKNDCRRVDYCTKKIIECEERLQEISTDLLGIKSPNMEGVYIVGDPTKEKKNELLFLEEEIMKEKEECERNIVRVNKILCLLNVMDERMIRELYIEKKNHEMIAEKYHFNRQNMYKHVNKALANIFKKK